ISSSLAYTARTLARRHFKPIFWEIGYLPELALRVRLLERGERSATRAKSQERLAECVCSNRKIRLLFVASVPHVKKIAIGRGRDVASALARRTIQRRPHVLLRVIQTLKRHLDGLALWQVVQIAQDHRSNFLVLSVPAVRHVRLLHGSEIRFLHGTAPLKLT